MFRSHALLFVFPAFIEVIFIFGLVMETGSTLHELLGSSFISGKKSCGTHSHSAVFIF